MEINEKQKSEDQISLLSNDLQADGKKQMLAMEEKPAILRDIIEAIFMADHDAVQFEQYLLENERKV